MGTSLSVDENNKKVLKDLRKGDLVQFPRGIYSHGFYSHWAVYVGEGHVVHLTGDDIERLPDIYNHPGDVFKIGGELFKKAKVKKDTFDIAANGSWAKKNNDKDKRFKPKAPQDIVDTANKKIGDIGYNVLWNNCESFASFCRYGIRHSDQGVNLWESGFKSLKYIFGKLHEPNSKRTRMTRIYLTNNQRKNQTS